MSEESGVKKILTVIYMKFQTQSNLNLSMLPFYLSIVTPHS